MNNKRKLLLSCLGILLILLSYILLSAWRDYRNEKKIAEQMLIPIGEINDMIPTDDISLSNVGTMPEEQESLQDYPDRIAILNKSVLADTTLPSYGLKTLEAYLTEYFDYYWDTGVNYYAEVVEDSFKGDYNLPSFNLYVEELDLEIECIWYSSRQVYHFYSRFNPRD